GTLRTLSGSSLCSSWPKTGSTIAGGYKVTIGFCNDNLQTGILQPVQKNWSFENRAKTHTVGDVMSSSLSYTIFPGNVNAFLSNISTQSGSVPAGSTIAYQDNISDDGSITYTQYDPYSSIDFGQFDIGQDPVMIPMHVSYNVIAIPIWEITYGLSLSI